jgi:hypothetical protein
MSLLSIRMLGAALGLPFAALRLRLTIHDSQFRLTTRGSRASARDSRFIHSPYPSPALIASFPAPVPQSNRTLSNPIISNPIIISQLP